MTSKYAAGDYIQRVPDADGRVPIAYGSCKVLYVGPSKVAEVNEQYADWKGKTVYLLEDQLPGRHGKHRCEFLQEGIDTEDWEYAPRGIFGFLAFVNAVFVLLVWRPLCFIVREERERWQRRM